MDSTECLINPEFKKDIFLNIDKTGQAIKEDLEIQSKKFLEQSRKKIDSQINCAKFEASYGFTVSKNERSKTMKQVKEVRLELWEKALRDSEGDTKSAYVFYKNACSFP